MQNVKCIMQNYGVPFGTYLIISFILHFAL